MRASTVVPHGDGGYVAVAGVRSLRLWVHCAGGGVVAVLWDTAFSDTREVPHDQYACYGSRLHCMWHNVDEAEPEGSWVCRECWHVFPEGQPHPYACPLCAHDW